MSKTPPKPSLPTRTPTEDAQINWPPSDEELAQCFYIAVPESEAAQGVVEFEHEAVDAPVVELQPTMAVGSSTALETSAGLLDPSASPDGVAVVQDATPAASVPEQSDGPPEQRSAIDDATTSTIAAASEEPAPDGPRTGDWVAEIAHLQALIEALTETVDWRIPNDRR